MLGLEEEDQQRIEYENSCIKDENLTTLLFTMHNEGKDVCSSCEETTTIICCNRCGNAVCKLPTCSTLFPHYRNTLFVICNGCSETIYGKMKPVEIPDVDKLTLLKKKIKTRQSSK